MSHDLALRQALSNPSELSTFRAVAAASEAGWMTIEELSSRSGVTTRNIRAYQSRGLLPAPISRRGARAAFYTGEHLARIRLVNRLQERGFSLAGIRDLLAAWTEGKTIEQVLGIESALADTEETTSQVVSEKDLRTLLAPGVDARKAIRKLESVGVIRRRGRDYHIAHPSVLELGRDAITAGISFEATLDEFVRLQEDLHGIARRFVDLYATRVIDPMLAGENSEPLPEILEGLRHIRKLAVEATLPLMRQALTDEIEAAIRARMPSPPDEKPT